MTLNVAILNDFEIVVRGLHSMLAPFSDRLRVVELTTDTSVVRDVDITLYDTFSNPQVDSGDMDEILAGRGDGVGAVVVYTWSTRPDLVQLALEKGCRGYLDKGLTGEELVRALEQIAAGEVVTTPIRDESEVGLADLVHGDWPGRSTGLTPREAEVVSLITQGLTNQDIAVRTCLSLNSIKGYIRTAYRKMGVTRRSQAVRWGHEHGMTPDRVRVLPTTARSERVV